MDPEKEKRFRFRMRMEAEDEAERGALPTAPNDPAPVTPGQRIAGTPLASMLAGAVSPITAATQLLGGEQGRQAVKDIETYREAGKKAQGREGFDWFELAGSMAPTAMIGRGIGAALPVAGAGLKALAQRAGVGALQGGAVAAATPSEGVTAEQYIPKKIEQVGMGTLVGAAMPPILQAGQSIYNLGKSAVEPIYESGRKAILQRFQQGLLGNDPARIAAATQAAQQARTIVPGSPPTTGEALAYLPGATGIAAHQQNIAKLPTISPQFAERATQQEAARSMALQPIAQTPAALEKAIEKRAAQAKALYGAAAPQVVTPDAAFKDLLTRPSMGSVLKRAGDLAKEQGDVFTIGKNLPERTVTSPIISASGQPITSTLPAETEKFPVKSLHYMKMAMDDLLKNPERFGIGATEAGAIGKTQKEFVTWLGKKSPAYEAAREAYKKASAPINRMQVGQELEKTLATPLGTSERAGMFAKAVEEAPRTIKRATGQTRFEKLEEVLKPSETKSVRQVAQELARQDAFKRGARMTSLSGADAIPGKVGLPLPNLLSRPAMIANFIMGKFGQSAEDKIAQQAAQQYLNPAQFAAGQANVPARYQPMIEALMRQAAPQAAGLAARGY